MIFLQEDILRFGQNILAMPTQPTYKKEDRARNNTSRRTPPPPRAASVAVPPPLCCHRRDEGSGKEGEDGKGDGEGDNGVL